MKSFRIPMGESLICFLFFLTVSLGQDASMSSNPTTHTYYIAADEIVWDYAPSGMNQTISSSRILMFRCRPCSMSSGHPDASITTKRTTFAT